MGWEILFAKKTGCSKQIHLGDTSQNIHSIEGQNWKKKVTPKFCREVHGANKKFIWSKLEMTILELQ